MTKRELAGDIVRYFGRYIEDAPKMKYHIRLGYLSFHAEDTHLLADKLAAKFKKTTLLYWHRQIPLDEFDEYDDE